MGFAVARSVDDTLLLDKFQQRKMICSYPCKYMYIYITGINVENLAAVYKTKTKTKSRIQNRHSKENENNI